MTDILAGGWVKTRTHFEQIMSGFGLGAITEDGFVPHPHLLITGADGFSGWHGIISDPTGETDEDGFPIYTQRDGFYFNATALDIRTDPARKSLARNLRHRVLQDGTEEKYPAYEEDGVTRKPLLQRTRLIDVGTAGGGQYIATVGVTRASGPEDSKMPRRIEVYDGRGWLVFTAYSLEDGDIQTPANITL